MRFNLAALFVLAAVLTSCDQSAPPEEEGPPADVTGTWSGDADVPLDTTITLVDHPTYRAVEIRAVYSVATSFELTDTAGDVRGFLDDDHVAEGEIAYVRHDGVAVRDPYFDDRLGGGSVGVRAIYVAPTLTIEEAEYLDAFEGLAIDFSAGPGTFRRRLDARVSLPRLDNQRVDIVREGVETTLRLEPEG